MIDGLKLACPDALGGTAQAPVLIGNCCRACGEPFFPAARSCTRCSGTELEACELGNAGSLWSWTVQRFQPKAPYDVGEAPEQFQPYGLGYVQVACGLKVQTRLVGEGVARFEIGHPMRLVLLPYRHDEAGADVFTYAFEAAA
jgi:uncharacterized OB-fold protein